MRTVHLLCRLAALWWKTGSLERAIWMLDYEIALESINA